jgi:hypothetical protein
VARVARAPSPANAKSNLGSEGSERWRPHKFCHPERRDFTK